MHKSTSLPYAGFKKWKPARMLKWPFLSIPLLGMVSNTLVNLVLDLKYQRPLLSMSLEEYINALLAAWILLKGTRAISSWLDRQLPWEAGARKRLFVQMGLHLTYIVVVFNLVLIGFTYALYGGFYNPGDILVIDVCVVAMSFLFSAIDSAIAFFANWRQAKKSPISIPSGVNKTVSVSQGKTKHLIKIEEIRFAVSSNGLVYIHTDKKRFVYTQSLDGLMEQLDERFFRANRQVILHYSAVSNFSSQPQGKVLVKYGEEGAESLMVSRTKAATFRHWIKSKGKTDPMPESTALSTKLV